MPPISGSLPIDFGPERLHLLPDRAVWWEARRTLIVADVHLGKGAAFRKAGVPVPAGGSDKDLRRIDALLTLTAAQRLVVLGDLVHARASHQTELFDAVSAWRERTRAVKMLLVRGNHDRRAGKIPTSWEIDELEEPVEESGILFSHEPRYDAAAPVLSGHVHPVFAMRDFDRSTVRVPCFVFDAATCAVLPAFGTFTGGQVMRGEVGRRIYLALGKSVIAVDLSKT
jgi:DNA ligase-associated metallophosphoesterase